MYNLSYRQAIDNINCDYLLHVHYNKLLFTFFAGYVMIGCLLTVCKFTWTQIIK